MKFKKNVSIILGIAIIIAITVSGCSTKNINAEKQDTEKTVVAVTVVPEKTFVEAVCGDLADVVVMVPPGNSPANYEPTPKLMEQFSKVKIYFSIGVPTEKANIMPKVSELKDMKNIKLHEEVAKTYPERELSAGVRDPHIWLSPKRAKLMVNIIAREMSNLDPENKDTYTNNAQAYSSKLDGLDKDIQKSLDGVKNRKFIVFHPAFGYLADDYNIEMFALEKDGKEATAERLKEMIDFAKSENIKAIFYQSEITSKQAEAFAQEMGGKTIELAPLAPNYIDNLKNMSELMAEVMK